MTMSSPTGREAESPLSEDPNIATAADDRRAEWAEWIEEQRALDVRIEEVLAADRRDRWDGGQPFYAEPPPRTPGTEVVVRGTRSGMISPLPSLYPALPRELLKRNR